MSFYGRDKLKIIILFLLPMVSIACRSEAQPPTAGAGANYYMGSANCKLCHGPYLPATYHSTHYEDWLSSAHGKTATVKPSDATIAADMNGDGTNDFKVALDMGTLPEWSAFTAGGGAGGEFAPVLGYTPENDSYTVAIGTRTFTVEKLIGTGRGKQAYLTRMGSSLYVLPGVYETASSNWTPLAPENWYTWTDTDSNGFIDTGETVTGLIYATTSQTPVSEGRTGDCWERLCAGCHVTGLVSLSKNPQGEFLLSYHEEGVACEACHGPGYLHSSTLGGRGYPDRAIVNPAKLSADLRDDVCMACHSRGISTGTVGTDYFEYPWNADGTPFLPGQELTGAFSIAPKSKEELHYLQGCMLHMGVAGSKYGSWSTGCQDCHSATIPPISRTSA